MGTHTIADREVFMLTVLLPVAVYLDIFIIKQGANANDFELTFRYENQSCSPPKFHWCTYVNMLHYLSEH